MKKENGILAAFLLNAAFSLFELLGGLFTGSVAILSDSVHDLGDALSIGASYLLEKKSKREADERYTYGYGRYSVIGGAFTTLILLCGSAAVIAASIKRLFVPAEINYDGMIVFAVVGVCVNLFAVYLTRGNDSLNSRAVSLHMLEDVFGWAAVLVGAVIMRFTELSFIDPVMSICTSGIILTGATKNLLRIVEIVTDKIPEEISVGELSARVTEIEGVESVHHLHLRTIDGVTAACSMHVVTDGDAADIKKRIRATLSEIGIEHCTLELERVGEKCSDAECRLEQCGRTEHHHHHGHHVHHDRHDRRKNERV